ncbi:MAG: S8 family serine peptidase [Deltaproteobacteria bacterium]|nr:S8 family serine peptidase [Deltaproteobacteria bacterium]MBW2395277.1 S8 family serine peptidase [Deltaproteobacteria bacterium]
MMLPYSLRLLGLALVALLAGTAGAAPPSAIPAEVHSRVLSEGSARVIVEFADPAFAAGARQRGRSAVNRQRIADTGARVEARLPALAMQRMRRFDELPLLAIEADAATLTALAASPDVVAVYPDRLYAPGLYQTIPLIGADLTTEVMYDGRGWAVAIIDTGVDSGHPTFGGRVVEEACFSILGDCAGGVTQLVGTGAAPNCSYSTDCFHGTHVTGIAAGEHTTYTGVAPGADIVSIRVFSEFTGSANCGSAPDPCPLAYSSDILAGLNFVRISATSPIAAVNMSLGGGKFRSQGACNASDPPMASEVAAVRAAGIAPVASSGNESFTNAMGSPGCFTGMISVGNTTDNDVVSSSSNSASYLTLLAPGTSVKSSVPPSLFGGTLWAVATGTSLAAPHVSGAFAAMRSAIPSLTVDDGLQALIDTGTPVTDSRNGITKPRIDLELAIKSLGPGECFNGLDDDLDGFADYPSDPGCLTGLWPEDPACQDGIDNDGDGRIDFTGASPDFGCTSSFDISEAGPSSSCGIGFELVLALPLLVAARRRRAASPA